MALLPASLSSSSLEDRLALQRSRILRIAAITFLGVLLVAGQAGNALGYGTPIACGPRAESKVFAQWGDTGNYFRVSNGGFEAGATDWLLTGGATAVLGNQPWKVTSTESRSLRIPFGATAESRTFCVSRGEDVIRLFVNNTKVPGSILHVQAIVRGSSGETAQTAFDVNGDAAPKGWYPTMQLRIPNLLGGSGTQELTLRFSTRGAAATWHIDDVYVDPYKSY